MQQFYFTAYGPEESTTNSYNFCALIAECVSFVCDLSLPTSLSTKKEGNKSTDSRLLPDN